MPGYLTRTEVCHLLGVSPKSLYLWERDGRIPAPRRDRRNWRVYAPKEVEAIRRFLGVGRPEPRPARTPLESDTPPAGTLSARNQLSGTIVSLRRSGLMCEVVLRLGDGQEITSIITDSSARRLRLHKGGPATAIIKATEVMMMR